MIKKPFRTVQRDGKTVTLKPCPECEGTGECQASRYLDPQITIYCNGSGCKECDYSGLCDWCAGKGEIDQDEL